ncbi:MAG: signal peptidase II [Sedimentisphaerales bacterium]|jgi:signal peptidase II
MNGEQKTNLTSSVLSPPSPGIRHLIFWSIFGGGLAFDLWTKKAVFVWLENMQEQCVTIIDGFLRLQLAENPGAAFGIAGGHRIMLVSISAAALVVIIAVFMFALREGKIVVVALALFAAGIAGNLYDRAFNGGLVRDFIDIVYWPGRHWPAFNMADSMLCTAVGLLIIASLVSPKSCQTPAHPQK